MSSFNNVKNSNGTNGSITLKSFSELASVLDLESLPPGPPDAANEPLSALEPAATQTEPAFVEAPAPIASTQVNLASLIAQLASVSSGLETMARQDARAREQATVELAQYEALAAERRETERALADARRIRATAESLVTEAFTEQARADAARHAAVARAAELACTQLLAERTRAADELASRPHLARVVPERRQREQERSEAAQRAEGERAVRLANGIAAAKQARHEGRLDEAASSWCHWSATFPAIRRFGLSWKPCAGRPTTCGSHLPRKR
jgi:chromosome segregation ATPase